MTSTTAPLFQRITAEAPKSTKVFQEAIIKLALVGMQLPAGSAEDHDWFKALNDMGDVLGLPDPYGAVTEDRPETTDTRPLYQRLEDKLPAEWLHKAQDVCFALGGLAVSIQIEAGIKLGQEFLDAVNVFMGPDGLGLPDETTYDPTVHSTVANYSGVDAAYLAATLDLGQTA